MADVTYNVFLVSGSTGELEVLLADESVTEIDGAKRVGNITHTDEEDNLSVKDNHVLYQHIRQMLYFVNRDGDPSFWPDNITDMSRMTINMYEPEEVPDPDPDPEPEPDPDPENPGDGEGGEG